MQALATQSESHGGLRGRLRQKLNRLRSKSRDHSVNANIDSTPKRPEEFKHATSTASSLYHRIRHASKESTVTGDNTDQTPTDQGDLLTVVDGGGLGQNAVADHSTLGVDIDVVVASSDIWSTAYREAVNNLGKDINGAILKGENVAQLFRQLEEIDKEASQESVFLRGVRYLHSLQVPLERLKLALDLATPLTNIEPTAATVFTVIRSVTAVSSFI
jgi:hypothetical protein